MPGNHEARQCRLHSLLSREFASKSRNSQQVASSVRATLGALAVWAVYLADSLWLQNTTGMHREASFVSAVLP